ncbi:hypothetical protein RRG08_056139 [Elysia crispata]|uniref:Uncharacterized protein n=1 Tax=Elysia crispata TaxID=231223 RepID=A0AAE0YRJ2_9GAST|nr:hypothetical protein RRG08_056139 [Elysia crispata]
MKECGYLSHESRQRQGCELIALSSQALVPRGRLSLSTTHARKYSRWRGAAYSNHSLARNICFTAAHPCLFSAESL